MPVEKEEILYDDGRMLDITQAKQVYEAQVVNHLVFPSFEENQARYSDDNPDLAGTEDCIKIVGEAAMSHEQARQLVQIHSSVVSDGFKLDSNASYVANRIRELAVE